MVFILLLITAIISGYIDSQNTYTRNDVVCNNRVCSLIQYQLQIVGNVYTLKNNNIKANVSFSNCNELQEFKLIKVNVVYNLIRDTYECQIQAIPLDYFFTSNVSSTVDFKCESNTNCSRYRYDRIGSSVTSTRIGSCNINYCTYCAFHGPWQLNLTSMMLERTMDTQNCYPIRYMSIADYFLLDSPITSSTVTTTAAKDSPITSSTVITTTAKDSPITSSTVTTTAAKDSPITSSTVTTTTAKDSPITSNNVTTTTAKDSPITSSTVTTTTAKDSTSKKSQSTLIWSFGTITVNLISCLLINGLK